MIYLLEFPHTFTSFPDHYKFKIFYFIIILLFSFSQYSIPVYINYYLKEKKNEKFI